MTFIEFFDAVDVMLDAAIGWIMLGSAIVSLLLLVAVAVVAWAAKRVRKGLGRACGALDAPKGAQDVPEAPDASKAPPEDFSYEEAA